MDDELVDPSPCCDPGKTLFQRAEERKATLDAGGGSDSSSAKVTLLAGSHRTFSASFDLSATDGIAAQVFLNGYRMVGREENE